MNAVGEHIINFAVYENATEFLGMADITLPDISLKKTTVSGAGISGDYDSPVIGHIDAMSMTVNFRTTNSSQVSLSTPGKHQLDIRAAMQERDRTGAVKKNSTRYVCVVENTKLTSGKLAPASSQDASGEYSVTYYAQYIGDTLVIEVDPLNFKYTVNGVDYLKDVRKMLGK